jgi:hypothetical protein
MIKITYRDAVDDIDHTKMLDKYDLIILRQAIVCQSKRDNVTLEPAFAKVYKQKIQELYEIFDSNLDITTIDIKY